MRLRVGDALVVVSTKTGADMGHDRMVTRLYSLRKPAPNVAAFGRAGEGHSGALALIFNDIPRMSHQGKVLAAHVCFGSEADLGARITNVGFTPRSGSSTARVKAQGVLVREPLKIRFALQRGIYARTLR